MTGADMTRHRLRLRPHTQGTHCKLAEAMRFVRNSGGNALRVWLFPEPSKALPQFFTQLHLECINEYRYRYRYKYRYRDRDGQIDR